MAEINLEIGEAIKFNGIRVKRINKVNYIIGESKGRFLKSEVNEELERLLLIKEEERNNGVESLKEELKRTKIDYLSQVVKRMTKKELTRIANELKKKIELAEKTIKESDNKEEKKRLEFKLECYKAEKDIIKTEYYSR